MDKKIFLEKLRETFPDFELTLGDARFSDGESIFVNGSSIKMAWNPSIDKWDSQSLELLLCDVESYIQETCHYFDIDTVIVKWCSGEEFTVWMEDLEIISGVEDLTNL
jgi:hypothetical protein